MPRCAQTWCRAARRFVAVSALRAEADRSVHRPEGQYSALRLYPRADGLRRAKLHRLRWFAGRRRRRRCFARGGATRRDQARDAMLRDLEAARYAADRAFRQYDAADPENRLVAGELETRWNHALARVGEIE